VAASRRAMSRSRSTTRGYCWGAGTA
jgi:hypothetical protein